MLKPNGKGFKVKFANANILLQFISFQFYDGFHSLFKDIRGAESVLKEWENDDRRWRDASKWVKKIKPFCHEKYFNMMDKDRKVKFYANLFKDRDVIALQEYTPAFSDIRNYFKDYHWVEHTKTHPDTTTKWGYKMCGVLMIKKSLFSLDAVEKPTHTTKKGDVQVGAFAKITHKTTGTPLIVGTFHIAGAFKGPDCERRRVEVESILASINTLEKDGKLPHIFGGDVNCPSGKVMGEEEAKPAGGYANIWKTLKKKGFGTGVLDSQGGYITSWKNRSKPEKRRLKNTDKKFTGKYTTKGKMMHGDDIFINKNVRIIRFLEPDSQLDIMREHLRNGNVNGAMLRPSNPSDHSYQMVDLEVAAK